MDSEVWKKMRRYKWMVREKQRHEIMINFSWQYHRISIENCMKQA